MMSFDSTDLKSLLRAEGPILPSLCTLALTACLPGWPKGVRRVSGANAETLLRDTSTEWALVWTSIAMYRNWKPFKSLQERFHMYGFKKNKIFIEKVGRYIQCRNLDFRGPRLMNF